MVKQRLPQEEMNRRSQPYGVIARPRQLHRVMVVRAMVISAGPPVGVSQADV